MDVSLAAFLREHRVLPGAMQQINELHPDLTCAELKEQIARAQHQPEIRESVHFVIASLLRGARPTPARRSEYSALAQALSQQFLADNRHQQVSQVLL